MFAIFKKELRSYFINPIGYVFVGIFLLFSALACCYTTLLSRSYDVSLYFTIAVLGFAVLIPLLTMRLFSDERKMRTEQLLLTAPISITGMVLGKFFAAFALFLGCMAATCLNFIPLYVIAAAERGNLDYDSVFIGPVTSQIVGGMIGLILIGAAFIAIGTFVSSLTENQLAAAVITISANAGLVGIGLISPLVGDSLVFLRVILNWISVISRFSNLTNGVLDIAALVYFVSLAFIFVFLTIRVYEKRRWS